uniref:protein-glutamine gamma-glutamyltransferase n=1 Tax=Fundulus heteroclitus TaxID=8078 RepID=A0A3Q2QIM2_FUNHE
MVFTQSFQSCSIFTGQSHLQLSLVNLEIKENSISHETQGLSETHLVVRRGKPFKVTLLFGGRAWNPHTERLVLLVRLGRLAQRIPVVFSEEWSNLHRWSATVHPRDRHALSVSINICSPVLSSVGVYQLLVEIETIRHKHTYVAGTFALLCNPWLREDPVYMSDDALIEEYVKSDCGLVYCGTSANVQRRPWSFGQYEPGVLEACLALLQVSLQHQQNSHSDYISRADPVYLSLVLCGMVNCNDDLGVLAGKWQGDYRDGVKPTDWTGSAEILNRWLSSKFKPVLYGQCWVFASVLCTVMRVLGIPSRVVTVFNAAHDTDHNTTIEEYYTSTGEKLNLSNDSIWNFHVWVECWMRRPDLSPGFDGWQVVDPTPQERSGGLFRCGPCPVAAIKQRCLSVLYDTPFLYASVDGDVRRLIVHNGQVVGQTVDSETVGQLICTKSIGSDSPCNLTKTYKGLKSEKPSFMLIKTRLLPRAKSPSLEVSLSTEGLPVLGQSICLCVKVTNRSNHQRVLKENINAQMKEYNNNPEMTFWTEHNEVHIQPNKELTLHHTIAYSDYALILGNDSVVNAAVVIQDSLTNESILSAQEFTMGCVPITMEIEGGDSVQLKKEKTVYVTFTNSLDKPMRGAVLSVEGSGLLQGKKEARMGLLQPGEKIEQKVSIKATSHGTKLLVATLSHSNNSITFSRSYHKVSVM